MYQGKRVAKRNRKNSKKPLVLLVSLALLVTAVLGVTIAYLVTDTNQVENTFTPAQVSCEIKETMSTDKTAKESVSVTNTSNVSAYLRVAVVVNVLDEAGNVTIGTPTLNIPLASGWVKCEADGYYYYTSSVPAGTVVPFLAEGNSISLTDSDGTKYQVTILADAIQADGNAVTVGVSGGWTIH